MTRPDYFLPFADPIIIRVLAELPALDELDGRVSVQMLDVQPSLRIAATGDAEPPARWERTPIWQVEVWATDAVQAGTIATLIANVIPDVRDIRYPDAYISGAWVETQPRALTPDDTELFRYILEVGLRLHAPL